ncbi:hypothetical protein YC2023_036790 [Brassica napus]
MNPYYIINISPYEKRIATYNVSTFTSALIEDPWNAPAWPYPFRVNSSMSHVHMKELSFVSRVKSRLKEEEKTTYKD